MFCISVLCVCVYTSETSVPTWSDIVYFFFSCIVPKIGGVSWEGKGTDSVIFPPLYLHYCAFFVEVFQAKLFCPPMHLCSDLVLSLEMENQNLLQHKTAWLKKCPPSVILPLNYSWLHWLQYILVAFSLEFTNQMLILKFCVLNLFFLQTACKLGWHIKWSWILGIKCSILSWWYPFCFQVMRILNSYAY